MGVDLRLTREHLEGNATLMDTIDRETKMTQAQLDELKTCKNCQYFNEPNICTFSIEPNTTTHRDTADCSFWRNSKPHTVKHLMEENAKLRRNWKEAERVCEGYVQDNKRVRKNTDEVIENMKKTLTELSDYSWKEINLLRKTTGEYLCHIGKLKTKLEDAECNRDKWFNQADYCQKKLDNVESEAVILEELVASQEDEIATLKGKLEDYKNRLALTVDAAKHN